MAVLEGISKRQKANQRYCVVDNKVHPLGNIDINMVTFKELTVGDTYNLGIICSIDQELGLSVRQFIQPDIGGPFIYNQPVVIISKFHVPENMKVHRCEHVTSQTKRFMPRHLLFGRFRMWPYLTLVAFCSVSLSIAA